MKHIEFCIPTAGKAVPSGPDWIHEVKYDGYRMRLERERRPRPAVLEGGHDWTSGIPGSRRPREDPQEPVHLDGEAVALNVGRRLRLQKRPALPKYDDEVQLYAFDILTYDGDDLRKLPLHLRKTNLAQILRGRSQGIFTWGK